MEVEKTSKIPEDLIKILVEIGLVIVLLTLLLLAFELGDPRGIKDGVPLESEKGSLWNR